MQRESILMPYLRVMSTFRDRVRALAMAGAPASELLALSDQLRNVDLVDLGVALDDQDGQSPASSPPLDTDANHI
jgi:cysteinyl-tRNA synthetase